VFDFLAIFIEVASVCMADLSCRASVCSEILVWRCRAVELGVAISYFFWGHIYITRWCKILVANRRAQLIEWMNALLPEFSLPPDSTDEELRELLSDGVVLCRVVNTLIPGVLEASLFLLDNMCCFCFFVVLWRC
jgi:hypothetical protein